jgi:hypothetical protein
MWKTKVTDDLTGSKICRVKIPQTIYMHPVKITICSEYKKDVHLYKEITVTNEYLKF